MMATSVFMLLLAAVLTAVTAAATNSVSQCSCGFLDPDTQVVFTDSLIAYFNETDAVDNDVFEAQKFHHVKEQGWNSVYRVGAQPDNIRFINDTQFHPQLQVLELLTDPPTQEHLVNGGNLHSVRRDIQYGTFQAAIKPAGQWTGGTALSFGLRYNSSQSLQIDVMNMNDPDDAAMAALVNGEWPSDDTNTNFTVMEAAGENPWNSFTTVRMDWHKKNVNFWIQGNNTRSITKKDRSLPLAGSPLFLKSWSTGDKFYMEGPPSGNASKSHVLYVRAFFNSSVMTTADHQKFDERCKAASFCSIGDSSLRGSTAFTVASEAKWKLPKTDGVIKRNAGIVAACCSSFGIFALINVFFRRTPWAKLKPSNRKGDSHRTSDWKAFLSGSLYKVPQAESVNSSGSSENVQLQKMGPYGVASGYSTPSFATPLPAYGSYTPRSGAQTPAPAYETPPPLPDADGRYRSVSMVSLPQLHPSQTSISAAEDISRRDTPDNNGLDVIEETRPLGHNHEQNLGEDDISPVNPFASRPTTPNPFSDRNALQSAAGEKRSESPVSAHARSVEQWNFPVSEKGKQANVSVAPIDPPLATTPLEPVTEAPKDPAIPAPTKRIDYLAGLVAVACLGVTLHHWCQTFWPWVTNGYGPGAHYPEAEKYLRVILGSYLLTNLWIGPFFLTATRFLSTNYLKNGNLEDIAKKMLRRMPRLFVPIIIISLLEYFLIAMGLTAALQYLPSISWTTWPYVSAQPNFGAYLNNIIELMYLMPNAIPEIVTHYCIGVLWTVPVQLQFTYVVLAASVVIRDIKTPWKRFGFYFLVILSAWYARSWAACHWAGLALSDLDATYKWKVYLGKHAWAKWSVMTVAFLFAAGSPLIGAFNQKWSFDTFENSLHPDTESGRPIMDVDSTYPNYNEPTLAIILFSTGLQVLVELSTWVQWFLSSKAILLLHPHIMTIYLTHGFVMWTWGSWVCLALGETEVVPYWANLLINLVTTYALIFLLAACLTPLMEVPVQAVMRILDRWTKQEPKPRRPTVAPYQKNLVQGRLAGEEAPAGES